MEPEHIGQPGRPASLFVMDVPSRGGDDCIHGLASPGRRRQEHRTFVLLPGTTIPGALRSTWPAVKFIA